MGKKSLDYLSLAEIFFNNYHTSIAIMDRDFNFIRVNELYAKADNRSVNDFPGHNHFEFYPGAEAQALFENVVSSKQTFQIFACPFVYPDNPQRGITYWDWTLIPVLDDTGEVQLLILTLYDVTERKRKEIELERFFEMSYDLLCVVDRNFVIKRVNRGFERVLGYMKSEMVGDKGYAFIHPKDIGKLLQEVDQQIKSHLPIVNFLIRLCCQDGNYKWIEFNNIFIPEEQVFYAIGRDITEKMKTQKEIARLDQLNLIGQMAAGIGHEVRNPMTTVRGFLQMLSQKEECFNYNGYFDLMIEELDRANAIITQYLSLANDRESELVNQNLNDIINELYPLLQADALSSNQKVIIEQQILPDLSLNKKEIHQLIINLVRNGLEAMEDSGFLTIRTYMEEQKIVLAVKDEGAGIDPAIIDKLGTPFFTTKDQGTGLGLATCYSIAERHNAKIDLDSNPAGTTFYVKFKTKPEQTHLP